jgi:3-hydroxyisobutyrate dehydrogenase
MADVSRVGFLGFGDIGLPMARRVVGRGYQMTICGHVRRAPIEEMKSLGAIEVQTPREVAERSDVTITMVLTEAQTREVIAGPEGLLQGAAAGTGIIMMSTLSPDFCRQMEREAAKKGVAVMDAPVAGGRVGAEAGKLGISFGGPKDAMERHRALLETMGSILYCGGVGTGEVVKLANNMVAFTNILVAHEAISWGIRNGADEDMLVKLMRMGSAGSWMLQNWEGVRKSWEDPNSPAFQIAVKDLSIALRIGEEVRHSCPFAALACEFWKAGAPRMPGAKPGP